MDADFLYDEDVWTPLQMMGMLACSTSTVPVSATIPAVPRWPRLKTPPTTCCWRPSTAAGTSRLRAARPVLTPESETTSERNYAMAAYRVTPLFQPGLDDPLDLPNADDRDGSSRAARWRWTAENGRAAVQHDVAVSVRLDINSHLLFKLEGRTNTARTAASARRSTTARRPAAQAELGVVSGQVHRGLLTRRLDARTKARSLSIAAPPSMLRSHVRSLVVQSWSLFRPG